MGDRYWISSLSVCLSNTSNEAPKTDFGHWISEPRRFYLHARRGTPHLTNSPFMEAQFLHTNTRDAWTVHLLQGRESMAPLYRPPQPNTVKVVAPRLAQA